MPRHARLDAPGLMHHVMARGLNRQAIFRGPDDYSDFLRRIPPALERSPNQILAWALMPNHVHFLIRSGDHGIAPFFRRLFTGYALAFNRRHERVGYLFQGRYKSLVCEEEAYLLTLVRYIHLNPVAGGIVRSLGALRTYGYTGHGALMGVQERPWQAVDEVLGRFGRQAGAARQKYEGFLRDGLPEVRQAATDLLGGGLFESLKQAAAEARRESDRPLADPRVLGESDFVSRVWEQSESRQSEQQRLKREGIDLRAIAGKIAAVFGIPERRLFERGRTADVSAAKAALILAGVEYFGQTLQAMAQLTRMSLPAASKARRRAAEFEGDRAITKLIS